MATVLSALATEIARSGYAIVADAAPRRLIRTIDHDLAEPFEQTPFCQGDFYGPTTKRFGGLPRRSDGIDALIRQPDILAAVEALLGPYCDTVQLNVAQAIAIHPGARAQVPHRDQDMWRAPPGHAEYLVNVIWPLTAFTAANGATRIWRGSHRPADWDAMPEGDPVVAEMDPGSALLFLGSTLHAAGANTQETVRRGIVIGYSLGWLRPYENPALAYPPAVARHFDPELAALMGYRQHRPNLGNYEGQCPSVLLGDDWHRPLAAIDALRPDQVDAVAYHAAQQGAP